MCPRPTSNGPNERASISSLANPPLLLLLLRFRILLPPSSPVSARPSVREKPPDKAGRQADRQTGRQALAAQRRGARRGKDGRTSTSIATLRQKKEESQIISQTCDLTRMRGQSNSPIACVSPQASSPESPGVGIMDQQQIGPPIVCAEPYPSPDEDRECVSDYERQRE